MRDFTSLAHQNHKQAANYMLFLWVALGGAIGSVLRYSTSLLVPHLLGSSFPYPTLFVNILGSFVMGLLTALFLTKWGSQHEALKVFFCVGLLGGFTTFSSFSLDTATLMEGHQLLPAFLYIFLSLGLSLGAVFLGLWLGRLSAI